MATFQDNNLKELTEVVELPQKDKGSEEDAEEYDDSSEEDQQKFEEAVEADKIYKDRQTRTLWQLVGGEWKCAVCSGSLTLCRGCGGMSSLYPQLFGSCTENVMCPNCIGLSGPFEDDRIVEYNKKKKYITVKYWDRNFHEDFGELMFISFFPMDGQWN